MSTTQASRSGTARIAAYCLHARGRTNTGPARAAFLGRFFLEVDPSGLLSIEERERRAKFARKAYFTRLALRSARARSRRREAA